MLGYEVYELHGLLILDVVHLEETGSYKAEHARILKSEKHQPVLSFRKKRYKKIWKLYLGHIDVLAGEKPRANPVAYFDICREYYGMEMHGQYAAGERVAV